MPEPEQEAQQALEAGGIERELRDRESLLATKDAVRLAPKFVEIHARSLAARENSPQRRSTLHDDGERRSDFDFRTQTVHV